MTLRAMAGLGALYRNIHLISFFQQLSHTMQTEQEQFLPNPFFRQSIIPKICS